MLVFSSDVLKVQSRDTFCVIRFWGKVWFLYGFACELILREILSGSFRHSVGRLVSETMLVLNSEAVATPSEGYWPPK